MKIAILCPTLFTFQGVSRLAWQQAEELTALGNEVTIFALKANMRPPNNVHLQILGMPNSFVMQRAYRLLFPLDIVKMIKWVPKIKGFDEIYCYEYPLTWLGYFGKKLYKEKYIFYNTHFNPPEAFPNLIERTYVKFRFMLEKYTIKRADAAISISKYSKNQLKNIMGLDSEVIYINIDKQRFHLGIDGTRVREKYDLSNNPIVLFVGHISPNKGVHLLIGAFNLVSKKIPNARLVIVGKHHYSNYSRDLAKISDSSIIFVGDVSDEDLPSYYAACNVYATASLWEGFDMPVAEAQACGKPVVAFDIGSHPEVVKVGVAGKLVPVGDTKAMAEAILGFIKLPIGEEG